MTQNNNFEIQHVLKFIPFKRLFFFFHKPAWSYRIADFYREEALKTVFLNVKGRLLDFGCGSKPYFNLLKNTHITEWVGVDLEKRTSGHSLENSADLFFIDGSIPGKNNSFDVVLSTQVFEHVPDYDHALTEIYRVLKPSGIAVVTVPMTAVLHEEPHDYRRFTPYGFIYDTTKIGFKNHAIIALGGPITLLGTLIANHLNFFLKIPLLGRPIFTLFNFLVTQAGLIAEGVAFRLGYRKATISGDYLFVATKGL